MPSSDDAEDRLVAAMLLRDGRAQTEQALEDGVSGYNAALGSAKKINGRLLKGEMSQVRSYNRRCGVQPLPAPETVGLGPDPGRYTSALDLEFVRQAHQRRQRAAEGPATEEAADSAPKKRQRLGAGGSVIDIAEASAAEARQAEEDAELANPLMRGPASTPSKPSKAAPKATGPRDGKGDGKGREDREEEVLWPSKGLRVRVVDEEEGGRFHSSHLKKGVVSKRHSAKLRVDVTLDGCKTVLREVPQSKLETVVSKTCEQVEIVRGEHRGEMVKLVKRDPRRNVAVVRLAGSVDHALPLDDVCEFV